jgi:threonyl-tRNA synthetase
VVGGREAESGAVAVRHRKRGDLGTSDTGEFIAKITGEIATKALE